MILNGKIIPFPSIPYVSFFKPIEQLRELAKGQDQEMAQYAADILKDVEQYPILEEGFNDLKLLKELEAPIKKINHFLFPDVLSSNEIKAVTPPFEFLPLYASKRFNKIIDSAGNNFSSLLKDMHSDQFYLQSCFFILGSYYGYPIQAGVPTMMEVTDKETGLMKTYRVTMNGDMVKFSPTKKAKDITQEDFQNLINNFGDIELWKSMFPEDSWIMSGIIMVNMMDVTVDQSIAAVTSNLLNKSDDSFVKINNGIKSLFQIADLEIGMISFNANVLNSIHKEDVKSLILDDVTRVDCDKYKDSEMFQKMMVRQEPLVISNVETYETDAIGPMLKLIKSTKFKSYILAPLVAEDVLYGFMELGSEQVYALNSISLSRLNHVIPVLALATRRFMTEMQNQIEAVIQQECTTVHSSVKWRFEQEAKSFIEKQYKQENAAFSDIIFKDVFPLYGQLDIKGSTVRRNQAVKKDLLKQIKLLNGVFKQAIDITGMPAYEELLFRLETFKSNLKGSLQAGDEHQIMEFFKSEIDPVLVYLQKADKRLQTSIESYRAKLDKDLGTIYEERKRFDDTVNILNQKLASYLDSKQAEAQLMFPHYFERYKTDGVEFNMYIGQSITKEKDFDPIHLQNLRLWQLKVMVEMEREYMKLQESLDLPLEISSLILVFNSPLAVHFRMDEKRFDVEGAYNARYEIIKKRIDKAMIKGTKERITIPGHIALVYTNEQDAIEYQKYISFLQAKGYLTDKVMDYKLEDLPGISGLRALRVEVQYENTTQSTLDVDELIKSIEQG